MTTHRELTLLKRSKVKVTRSVYPVLGNCIVGLAKVQQHELLQIL